MLWQSSYSQKTEKGMSGGEDTKFCQTEEQMKDFARLKDWSIKLHIKFSIKCEGTYWEKALWAHVGNGGL